MIGRQPDSTIIFVDESEESRSFEQRLRFELAIVGIDQQEPDMAKSPTIPLERIERKIVLLRNEKVILDADLAAMYGVTTTALNQAVRRNADRFPSDFMFQLTADEFTNLMSQTVTSSSHGGRRKLPSAFTEQGVAMLSSVLRSDRAVAVNVQIMRTFVRLRQMLASNATLARKLNDLEQKYDRQFKIVFDAIRELMIPPAESKKPPIGFLTESKRSRR